MNRLFLLLLLFIGKLTFAQGDVIDKYFEGFQQKNSLDVTTVSSKMFAAFLNKKEGKEKEELAAILKKLKGLKVLSKDGPKDGMELYTTACALMPKDYESILTLNETDRKAKFYTLEDASGKITELVMIAFQWGRFLVVSLTGDINLNDILKLSQNLNLQGLGDLQNQKVIQQ